MNEKFSCETQRWLSELKVPHKSLSLENIIADTRYSIGFIAVTIEDSLSCFLRTFSGDPFSAVGFFYKSTIGDFGSINITLFNTYNKYRPLWCQHLNINTLNKLLEISLVSKVIIHPFKGDEKSSDSFRNLLSSILVDYSDVYQETSHLAELSYFSVLNKDYTDGSFVSGYSLIEKSLLKFKDSFSGGLLIKRDILVKENEKNILDTISKDAFSKALSTMGALYITDEGFKNRFTISDNSKNNRFKESLLIMKSLLSSTLKTFKVKSLAGIPLRDIIKEYNNISTYFEDSHLKIEEIGVLEGNNNSGTNNSNGNNNINNNGNSNINGTNTSGKPLLVPAIITESAFLNVRYNNGDRLIIPSGGSSLEKISSQDLISILRFLERKSSDDIRFSVLINEIIIELAKRPKDKLSVE